MLGRFAELNKNVTYVSKLLLGDQDLCKLLYYNNSTPLSSTPIANTSTLLFKNIFPHPKNIVAITDEMSLLTFVFADAKLDNGNVKFKDYRLDINVICHMNLWACNDGIRPYLILNRIDKILNELRGTQLSIGKVLFNGMVYREYSNYYAGFLVSYNLVDFN